MGKYFLLAHSFFLIMKRFFVLYVFIVLIFTGYARKTIVNSAAAINNGNWTSSDTIVMKNGIWTNQSIVLKGNGTEVNPIVLIAETEGQVILNGNSSMSFSGKFIEVNGLYFKEGSLSTSSVIEFRTSSSQFAENSRLTNCCIESYNPADNTVDNKWVSLYGKDNQVDHCSFINKNNSGTLLVVWLTSGVTVNHIISDNYFGYRNSNLDASGSELNGQEIIRIGDSSTSMTTAACIVKNNFFENCNGEIEVISNKSCGNIYKNNLFFECKGMLTLRHGNNCVVEGNYFFGNGISDTGGVRIIGENHKVYNNYFEKLKGTNYRSAICIVRGKENSALNEYFQVKNALVAFNTFVNCNQAFSINYNSSSSLTLPPIGSVIAHNHIYNTSSSNTNVNISTVNLAAMDLSWKNNFMNQGKYTNFSYSSEQVTTAKNADMMIVQTPISIYEPSTNSQLVAYSTTDYPELVTDIRGRERGTNKLPGASEINGFVSLQMPVKKEVGAKFYNNPSTGLKQFADNSFFEYKILNNNLSITNSMSGQLSVFDISAKLKISSNLIQHENPTYTIDKGLYLVLFTSENRQIQTGKIMIN